MSAGPAHLRVVHVSPTHFDRDSVVGGGERFVEELARAMALGGTVERVKLISFGRSSASQRPLPRLERVILRSWTKHKMTPFSGRLFQELRGADVIHCHQYFVLPTFLAALQGRLQGSKVFVSDLGGGGWTPGYQIDQSRWITAHLPLSEYATQRLPGVNRRHQVIGGGVDLDRYRMRPQGEHDGSVVFLGRILPHKGVHDLVAALPPSTVLNVIGPATDAAYMEELRTMARGKEVRFHHGLDDARVISLLQRAMVLVHPTPVDAGGSPGANELFGLALVEAMACGCPVVASSVASLPEIVTHECSGWLVAPGDRSAIRTAIQRLSADRELWLRLSVGARARAESFSWHRVAERCLDAYLAVHTRPVEDMALPSAR